MSRATVATRVAAVYLVELYQDATGHRPSRCRFVPTCSNYAIEAIEQRGLVVGLALVVRRLARCHPLGGRGFDPVPG
jgi:uncharacterized protein